MSLIDFSNNKWGYPGGSVIKNLPANAGDTGRGLPFPSPGDLPDPGTKPQSLESPALADGFSTTNTTWEEKDKFGVCCSHLYYQAKGCL